MFLLRNSSKYYHLYVFFILIELINISINRDCNKKHGDYYLADIKIRNYFYSKIRDI